MSQFPAHQPTRKPRPLTQTLSALLTLALINGGTTLTQILPVLAATAPGVEIRNRAKGSFEDPDDLGNVIEVDSNEVVVRVSEVAGITLTSTAAPEEAPNSVNSSNANQGDGEIMADDVVYFTFTLTNVGNDPTQFVLPDSPSGIINGTLFSPIEVIAYDADGSGGTAAVDLTGNTITVPNGGDTTGNLLNGISGTNNGSVPPEGTVTIRVPILADSGLSDGDRITVSMGDTTAIGDQNQPFTPGTADVATQDNPGTDNGDAAGPPANGEREASMSKVAMVGADDDGDGMTNLEEDCSDDRDNDGTQNCEDFDPRGYFYDESTGQIIAGGSISVTAPPGGVVTLDDDGSATGMYQWTASGAAGVYTMAVTPPPGYALSSTCVNSDPPAFNPPVGSSPVVLGAGENGSTGTLMSSDCGDNTYYLSFDLAPGDPLIINNNLPLVPTVGRDYGDAPDTYGTTAGSNGANHIIASGIHLGTAPDAEADASTPLDGSGDGAEDDGITLATLTEGDTSYTIPVAEISATGTGTLHAWLDFDKSGTFEPGEYTSVAVSSSTPAGDLTWNGITAGAAGDTYARFRFTSDTNINANTPGGAASDGEVEDYQVAIAQTPPPTFSCGAPGLYEVISGRLHIFNTLTAEYDPIGPAQDRYNSIGYNVNDNYLYGTGVGSPGTPTRNHLLRIAADGSITDLGDLGTRSFAGDMDRSNNLYFIAIGTDGSELEIVNVNDNTLTRSTQSFTGDNLGRVLDIVYFQNAGSGVFVGVESGQLVRYDLDTSSSSTVSVPGLPGDSYGAAWTASNGYLYASHNDTGTIYEIEDPLSASPQIVNTYSAAISSQHDGSACPDAPPPAFTSDLSDAPDTYGTDLTAGNSGSDPIGPSHGIIDGIHLGLLPPDAETNGQPTTAADGDGAEDDGITLATLTEGTNSYIIPAGDITATGTGTLHAWVDFDRSGTFEPSEHTSVSVTNGNPSGALNWSGLTVGNAGNTYARFRFTSDARINANTPGGAASDGEVEDYRVEIVVSTYSISGTLYEDVDSEDDFDPGEPPLPSNVTVRLFTSDGSVEIASTTTDGSGNYTFPNIPAGTYQIEVEASDPDIPTGFQEGTPNPLTVTVSNADLANNNFGFDDRSMEPGFAPFCVNDYGEVYVGQGNPGGNRIYAIQGDTGAVTTVTNNALATPNSLAADHRNRVVYYAEGSAIYAWDPISNMHQRLSDLNGNNNALTMPGTRTPNPTSFSSGGAAFYNGSLYLGVDAQFAGGGVFDIYRVDFVPGTGGKTIQSINALGVNAASGNQLSTSNWGDFIISDSGIIYAASGGTAGVWSYNLNTNTYQDIVNDASFPPAQLAKDGQGRLFALPNAGVSANSIVEIEISGNSIAIVGTASSITPASGFDAAECVIGRSTIGDRIWNDVDTDGVQDPGEQGIPNVTVGLYRDITNNGLTADDPLLGTRVTSASGNYDFPDLIFGNYIVRVLEGTPDDQDSTNVLDGANVTSAAGDTISVTLSPGVVDFNDADVGYDMFTVPSDPNVLLVKRITRVNGQTTNGTINLDTYFDDPTYPYDDNTLDTPEPDPIDTANWPTPSTFLKGAIDGGKTRPDDEIEYTIYFLSTGDKEATNVQLCDKIPSFQTFVPDAYNSFPPAPNGGVGANRGIEVEYNGSALTYTNDADGDTAQYYPPNAPLPAACDNAPAQTEDNGAIVVNLGDLPQATGPGTPATSYGAVRFRARVK